MMIDTSPREAERRAAERQLASLNAAAKKQQRLVARFTGDDPTGWDMAHRRMDGPLDDWLAARG